MATAPGADAPTLSDEERQSIRDDLSRASAELIDSRKQIANAERGLAAAMPTGRLAPIGSEPWSQAQMLLSRLDDARATLEGIDARLVPALLLTDGLADDDPDRAAVLALRAKLAAEADRAANASRMAEPSRSGS